MLTTLFILSIISISLWLLQMILSYIFCVNEFNEAVDLSPPPPISVILPVFNEKSEDITRTLESIVNQKNVELEIFVIDDGSAIPLQIPSYPNVKLIRMEKNVGKRAAQIAAITQASHDWIATVDSDTILDKYALFYLYKATELQKADAVTGTVFVSNRKQNLLTKIISCMYGLSIFQQRAEQAYFGCVNCCSGALSMYRKSIMLEHLDHYANQTFLGRKCMAGDDRHMTSLFLLSGHRVGWTSRAKCWTKSPSTLKGILKQQVRWCRSNASELFYLASRVNKWTIPFLFFTVKLMFLYFYRVFLYISMIYFTTITLSLIPVIAIIATLLATSAIKCVLEYIWGNTPSGETSGVKYLASYVLFEYFVITPTIVYGLLTPYKNGWLTRSTQKH